MILPLASTTTIPLTVSPAAEDRYEAANVPETLAKGPVTLRAVAVNRDPTDSELPTVAELTLNTEPVKL